MNRLATRLMLAITLIALISMTIGPITQVIAITQTLQRLPDDFRARVQQPIPQARNPQNRRPDNTPRTPNSSEPPVLPDAGELLQTAVITDSEVMTENRRLFTLLEDYRSAQRRGFLIGSISTLLLALGLAYWLNRSIIRPLGAVSDAATRLSQGSLSSRVTLKNPAAQTHEIMELAENFNHMAASLEQLEGERKAMIADVAHELRNPLAALQIRFDALEDGILPFNPEEVSVLRQQVNLLSRLTNDLHTLTLADSGRLSLQIYPRRLSNVVQPVINSYEVRAAQQNIRLEFTPCEDDCVPVDADRMSQVLRNLLDNALTVTPADGTIRVRIERQPDTVNLFVTDGGPGIPEAELATVFKRFVQGQRRDTRGKSGLGLDIVKSLVELHGGNVSVRNLQHDPVEQTGAEFKISIPVDHKISCN